jgi:subtilase family serine protease
MKNPLLNITSKLSGIFAAMLFFAGLPVMAQGPAVLPAQAVNHIRVCPPGQPAGTARCHSRVVTDKGGQVTSNVLPAGYGPAQFQGAYGLGGGSGTIAIVDAYDQPRIKADLDSYDSTFGLPLFPSCANISSTGCFLKVNQNGQTFNYPSFNSGWGLEISLDAEVAHAACPNCKLILVEANSNSFSDLLAAENMARTLGGNVISNSWGGNESPGETTYDANFNHPGTAYTFSSGDSGYGVEYPAASQFVTAVGGTTLTLSGNSYVSESAWSGAGSGCSSVEPKPGFQHDSGCANRTVADVSADADPNTGAAVLDTCYQFSRRRGCSGGWFQVGGTSLASPLVAATYATGGVVGGMQENSLPYTKGTSSNLHDVTAGSNGNCGGSYLCTAASGYDGPTGLGTPFGAGAF